MTKSVYTGEVQHSSKLSVTTPVKALIKHQVPLPPCITTGTQFNAQKQTQPNFCSFLEAFEKLRNATTRIVMYVCPSVWNNSDTARRIFMKFYI